jgi:hypothetical protein
MWEAVGCHYPHDLVGPWGRITVVGGRCITLPSCRSGGRIVDRGYTAAQDSSRVEGRRRASDPALSCSLVTTGTVRGINRCCMRLVAGQALLLDVLVTDTVVEGASAKVRLVTRLATHDCVRG